MIALGNWAVAVVAVAKNDGDESSHGRGDVFWFGEVLAAGCGWTPRGSDSFF
jgi:hypothetical protein